MEIWLYFFRINETMYDRSFLYCNFEQREKSKFYSFSFLHLEPSYSFKVPVFLGALLAYRFIVSFGALTAARPRLRASRGVHFFCSFLTMAAPPEIYKALNPKTDTFLIAKVCLYFKASRFDLSRGNSSVGIGRDLSAQYRRL